jgi:hypothetical protein
VGKHSQRDDDDSSLAGGGQQWTPLTEQPWSVPPAGPPPDVYAQYVYPAPQAAKRKHGRWLPITASAIGVFVLLVVLAGILGPKKDAPVVTVSQVGGQQSTVRAAVSASSVAVVTTTNVVAAPLTSVAPLVAATTTQAVVTPPSAVAQTTAAKPPAPVTSAQPPAVPAGCYPLSSAGNCYKAGQLCANAQHGQSGIASNGSAISCVDNNGWRWEPA